MGPNAPGVKNFEMVLMRRLSVHGFICVDHLVYADMCVRACVRAYMCVCVCLCDIHVI